MEKQQEIKYTFNQLTFTEKIQKVQSELKAPKGQYNSFGKYKYRSCEDILEAVKPILAKYGLVLVLSDTMVEIANKIYVKATATILDQENEYGVTAFAREPETKAGMDASQITGSTSSYARKYALNGLFLIDDTKDADTEEYSKQQLDKALLKQCEELQIDLAKVAVYYKKPVAELSNEDLTKAINQKKAAVKKVTAKNEGVVNGQ